MDRCNTTIKSISKRFKIQGLPGDQDKDPKGQNKMPDWWLTSRA
jgi:hypothetical protein